MFNCHLINHSWNFPEQRPSEFYRKQFWKNCILLQGLQLSPWLKMVRFTNGYLMCENQILISQKIFDILELKTHKLNLKCNLHLTWECWVLLHRQIYLVFFSLIFQMHIIMLNPGHSFPRTFVPTWFLTGPDIRAHIKWPPRTFVLTSNYHPGHSCSHQITCPDIRAHIKLLPRTFVLISTSFHLSILYMLIPSY